MILLGWITSSELVILWFLVNWCHCCQAKMYQISLVSNVLHFGHTKFTQIEHFYGTFFCWAWQKRQPQSTSGKQQREHGAKLLLLCFTAKSKRVLEWYECGVKNYPINVCLINGCVWLTVPVAPSGCPLEMSPPLGFITHLPPYVLSPRSISSPALPANEKQIIF